MSAKSNETIQQGVLFDPSDLEYRQEMTVIDGKEIPVTYGFEGSYVDTVKRAQYLVNALNSMSQRNKRNGISLAAYTDEYSAPIWRRYRGGTRNVLDGASINRNKFHRELRVNFWHATGFAALRSMRSLGDIMPREQINPRAQKMWDDFNHEYSNPKKVKERNEYKQLLELQIPSDEQLKLVA